MLHVPTLSRWRAAVTQAARQVLSARWHSTLEALEAARAEYGRLHGAEAIDVRAMRKAAQRVHELEQRRTILAYELHGGTLALPRGPGATS
jgi:hypothetical protein